ncbi:MAG: amino acid ABC transporter substrate-binding protein [Bacteroidetes bacterium]|nr:amino acid ABC transporter substrate-binding protein [Bacteroidota bacterium]
MGIKINTGRRSLFYSQLGYGLLLLCLLISNQIFAQDFKKQYKHAKTLFSDGKYSAAMDAFRPLTVYDRDNPYPEYASFYYGLSAHRLGFNTMAKEMLLQTKNIYSTWDQRDEVLYWLVKIYFDQREYFRALALAREIKDNSIQKEIEILKRLALAKESDVETLKMLLEDNKEETEVSRALAYAIGKQYPMADSTLLDSLVGKYGWNKKDFVVEVNPPVFKERYRVALLLPFLSDALEPSPGKKRSQFVLDLYQGMKLAADSLAKEGALIDLLAYDTDHDTDTIRKLLKAEELKSADLIVGPLFTEDSKPVQEFSKTNKINLIVNPLSGNEDLADSASCTLLYQPSYATVGEKSAEVLVSLKTKKNCYVFFGDTPKDSTMAFSFMQKAIKLGVTIKYAEEVHAETSANILAELATPTEYDEWKNPTQFKLPLDSLGSVFVASEDPLIYTKVINSVETRGDSVVVIGHERWLEGNSVDLGKFEKIRIIIAAPNYTPLYGKPFLQFRKEYFNRHGILPDTYAQRGFEFMMVMGRALKKYGVHFQQSLQQEGVPGVLTEGYLMRPTHDNGRIPFVAFSKGRLRVINKP